MTSEGVEIFTRAEVQNIITALLIGSGEDGVLESEILAFVDLMENWVVRAALARGVAEGRLLAKWMPEKDDWTFRIREKAE